MKRSPIFALSLVLVLAATDGQAQEKKNEVFGFGRKRNQISNALFPGGTETGTGPAPVVEAPKVERDSDTIFRGGKPKKIESAAYEIRNGEKIEKPLPEPKSKPSLFSKFRKDDSASPLLTATNASVDEEKPNRLLPPLGLKKEKQEEEPAPVVSAPVELRSDSPSEPTAEPAFTAAPMEEKKSGGLFSFFSRDKKKEDPIVSTPIPVASSVDSAAETAETTSDSGMTSASTVAASPDIPDAPGFSDSAPATPQPPAKPAAAPASQPAAPTAPVADQPAAPSDVPQFAGVETPSQEKKKGISLPNPIAKLKPEPKPVSLVGAETIIENGEIVKEEDDIVESNIVKTGDGQKEPPRIVDGVKTYNSWDDVEARSISAADRIISQMRQR